MPAATPPVVPDEIPIVATAGVPLVQVPPTDASCNVAVAPRQMDLAPEIVSGSGLTVKRDTATQPVLAL